MTLKEIIIKYPIRNSVWEINSDGTGLFAFAAEWEHSGEKDPWNRPMNRHYGSFMNIDRDTNGDIAGYSGYVGIDGVRVTLLIIND